MSKIKKVIVASILFVFLSTFASLGLSAIFSKSETPLITISEEIRIKTTTYTVGKDNYSIRFYGEVINNSDKELDDVEIKIYLNNKYTNLKNPVVVEIDDFLAGQTYNLETYVYSVKNEPLSVYKVSFTVDDSSEVYITNPEPTTNFVDIVIYFAFAFVLLVAIIVVVFSPSKHIFLDNDDYERMEEKKKRNKDDDDDDDDDKQAKREHELAEKELEIEKLKLEVEKKKLEKDGETQKSELKACPYCGTVSKATALKCPSCGANFKHH